MTTTTEQYQHGHQFGELNASIYGQSHAARYDYPHETDFCRGYRDGYTAFLSRIATDRKPQRGRPIKKIAS